MIDIKIQVITKQALGFSKKLQGLDFASIAFYRRHTPDGIAICRVNEACLVKTSHCLIRFALTQKLPATVSSMFSRLPSIIVILIYSSK